MSDSERDAPGTPGLVSWDETFEAFGDAKLQAPRFLDDGHKLLGSVSML